MATITVQLHGGPNDGEEHVAASEDWDAQPPELKLTFLEGDGTGDLQATGFAVYGFRDQNSDGGVYLRNYDFLRVDPAI